MSDVRAFWKLILTKILKQIHPFISKIFTHWPNLVEWMDCCCTWAFQWTWVKDSFLSSCHKEIFLQNLHLGFAAIQIINRRILKNLMHKLRCPLVRMWRVKLHFSKIRDKISILEVVNYLVAIWWFLDKLLVLGSIKSIGLRGLQ